MALNPNGEIILGAGGTTEFGIPDHVARPEEWQDYLSKIKVTLEVPRGNNKWGTQKIKVRLIDALVDQACKAFAEKGAALPITLDDGSFLVQEYRERRTVVVTVQHKIGTETYYVVLPVVLPEQEVAWLRVTGRWKAKKADPLRMLRMPSAAGSTMKH
jgi:hypothetical protein